MFVFPAVENNNIHRQRGRNMLMAANISDNLVSMCLESRFVAHFLLMVTLPSMVKKTCVA